MYPKLMPQNSDYALINWCSVKCSVLNILKLGYCKYKVQKKFQNVSLGEKCPNTELFLVRIFLYSDWIWTVSLRIQSEYRKIRTRNNSVFGRFSRSVLSKLQLISLTSFNWCCKIVMFQILNLLKAINKVLVL